MYMYDKHSYLNCTSTPEEITIFAGDKEAGVHTGCTPNFDIL